MAKTDAIHTPKAEAKAMNVSLIVGVLMLGAKWVAYMITGSVAIFSDAAESVVHIVAVGFAWRALRIMHRPPDADHHFGHEKVGFMSAGVEGGLIVLAAGVIVWTAIEKLLSGVTLEQVGLGSAITAGAGAVNALLGWYLVRTGRREHSLVITANGKHILTDAWTSAGAVIGLLLATSTGWLFLDPILAIVFGLNIVREGYKLVLASVNGLMDKTNPELEALARSIIVTFTTQHGLDFHRLRLRESGPRVHVDFHLIFPDATSVSDAHALATDLEDLISTAMPKHAEVISHIEPTTQPDGHV